MEDFDTSVPIVCSGVCGTLEQADVAAAALSFSSFSKIIFIMSVAEYFNFPKKSINLY